MDIFVFVSEQWILVSILLALIYLFVWRESAKNGPSLSHHDVTQLVNSDEGILIDIRDSKSFKAGHIAGAINIPSEKLSTRMNELKPFKDKKIILVDKLGQGTGTVGRTLKTEGYDAARLNGGISQWETNKLPLVKGK